jgi:hypothetical protein
VMGMWFLGLFVIGYLLDHVSEFVVRLLVV